MDKLIEPLVVFRSKGREYRPGERVYVTTEQCAHFCKQGWARDVSGEVATEHAAPADVSLNVESGAGGVVEGN